MYKAVVLKTLNYFQTIMLKRPLILILLSLAILGCDPEENQSENLPDDGIEGVDTTPPVPSIEGLDLSLEVATTVNISIQETSDIEEISVLVNQEEILNTREKTFSFELNPFDYPSGENTLTIISSDSEGNQGEQTQTFEVNKLLVSIAAPLIANSQQLYFSANTMEGELLSFATVNRRLEIVKLYADDDFTPQPIIVTSYKLEPEAIYRATINSIANIEPGTDLVKYQEAAGIPTENTYVAGSNNVSFLDITNIPSEKVAKSLLAAAYGHLGSSFPLEEQMTGFETRLQFTSGIDPTIENAFMYTSNAFLGPADDKIGIEEFEYLFLETLPNSSISFQQFKKPTAIQTINIPNTVASYFIDTFGYLNEESYRNNKYHFIYDQKGIENTNNAIEIPIIDEFEIVRNQLLMTLNDRNTLTVSTLGIKDIIPVDWTASRSDNTLEMYGDFDTFTLSLILNNNPDIGMQWSYTDKSQESYSIPFESFQFPEEFTSYAASQNLNIS
ncbi:MAG: hypothetical protein AAF039_18450, partial [Bacteroidota bacterium]